jgi:hypothetical protein
MEEGRADCSKMTHTKSQKLGACCEFTTMTSGPDHSSPDTAFANNAPRLAMT